MDKTVVVSELARGSSIRPITAIMAALRPEKGAQPPCWFPPTKSGRLLAKSSYDPSSDPVTAHFVEVNVKSQRRVVDGRQRYGASTPKGVGTAWNVTVRPGAAPTSIVPFIPRSVMRSSIG